MNANTLTPAVAAARLTAVAALAQNLSLNTDPRRMAVLKVLLMPAAAN